MFVGIAEARDLLKVLNFDAERSNERSALVLLALLDLPPDKPWVDASNPLLRTVEIMEWLRERYDKNYKPNTRETIRRFTLHQFVDAGLICAYYTPGGQVLYIGDADAKWLMTATEQLTELGVVVDEHGKMPDVVVYLPDRNWLVLMEAATSHGPVDAKRYRELRRLFAESSAGLVFVSCFPSREEMRKYLHQIAWETEVWCADNPTHLIHFNGERFLGPYE